MCTTSQPASRHKSAPKFEANDKSNFSAHLYGLRNKFCIFAGKYKRATADASATDDVRRNVNNREVVSKCILSLARKTKTKAIHVHTHPRRERERMERKRKRQLNDDRFKCALTFSEIDLYICCTCMWVVPFRIYLYINSYDLNTKCTTNW